jgi:hypothetical protein
MQTVQDGNEFVNLFMNDQIRVDTHKIEGLCARIVKGRAHVPQDFDTLTDCASDRTCFLMGSDGLLEFCRHGYQNVYQMLITIGFEEKYIKEKLDRNFRFELLIMPERANIAHATWGGAFQILQDAFPDVYESAKHTLNEISTTAFYDLLNKYKVEYSPFEVRANGKEDLRYITYERFCERFINSSVTLNAADLRLFMYYNMGIRELYKGDGFTYTEKGEKGVTEYMMRNRKRTEVEHVIIRLDHLQIPNHLEMKSD